MTKHYSEAELLETYYTQPGQSMPVMMHLAACADCAARYERLERKLREAAVCHTEKPATFWTRQRMQIMRRVDAHHAHTITAARTLRVAAAAILSFFLGGAVVYETVKPAPKQPAPVVVKVVPSASATPAPAANDLHDAWQSDELKDFHNVVEWEAWVPENKSSTNEGSSL
jgi:alpha-beta hydrolase superfamily lysophospholipase